MQTQTLHRKIISGTLKFAPTAGVADRVIEVTASDGEMDRQQDILEPAGAKIDNYRRNPVVLLNHNADQPVARTTRIGLDTNRITATIQFPAQGVSEKSDEVYRLIRAGVISAVSVGFLPLKWEPIRGAGLRFISWELLEVSMVAVPANPKARVTQKRVSATPTPRLDAAQVMLEIIRSSSIGERISRLAKIRAENRAALARARERWRNELDEPHGRRS